jgi:hypothetical protein
MDEERLIGHAETHEAASAATVEKQGFGVHVEVLRAEPKLALAMTPRSAFLLISFAMSAALRQSATGEPVYSPPPLPETDR